MAREREMNQRCYVYKFHAFVTITNWFKHDIFPLSLMTLSTTHSLITLFSHSKSQEDLETKCLN